jgi:hypothetical protein
MTDRQPDLWKELKGLDALLHALKDDHDLGDPETVLLILEGETQVAEACQIVLDDIDEKEALITGVKAKRDQFATREKVIKDRIEMLRVLLLMTLERLPVEDNQKQPRLELPGGLLLRTPKQSKLVIDDEYEIPGEFWERRDPVINNAALKAALKKADEKIKDLLDKADRENDPQERKRLLDLAEAARIPGAHLSEPGFTLTIRRS